MRRRDFIRATAAVTTTWPFAARAQQPARMRRVGVLRSDQPRQTISLGHARFRLDRRIEIINVGDEDRDLEAAFAGLTQKNIRALVVPGGAFLLSHRSQVVALAARNSIPAIYADREYVAAGGLLSYGPIQTEAYRGAGIYVSKILKGVKPAELSIDESAKFEFVFNLKAATALGIELPLSLMMQVSETIE